MMNGGRGHHILLVDDEEVFLSSLSEGLRRRFPEMSFRTASDGEIALQELGKHPADLVITDLKMPRMDGFQLIAAMHSQHPDVPLIIMTAHSTELSEGKVMSAGALHCIDKPVDLSELARRIDELFSTGASLRGVSLAAFLQLLGLERKSGIVDVRGSQTRARLYLSGGQIIHAEDGQQSGLAAALRAVSLDDVEINFRPGAVPKVPTIDLSLTQLLLDSARLRDEEDRGGGGGGSGGGDNFDQAFSESFSDAFDEQLNALEMKDDSGRPMTGQIPRLPRSSTGTSPPIFAGPISGPIAATISGTISAPGSGLTPPGGSVGAMFEEASVASAMEDPFAVSSGVPATMTSVSTSVSRSGFTATIVSPPPGLAAAAQAGTMTTAMPAIAIPAPRGPRSSPSTAPPMGAMTTALPSASSAPVAPMSSSGSAPSALLASPFASLPQPSPFGAPLASAAPNAPMTNPGTSPFASAAPNTQMTNPGTSPIYTPFSTQSSTTTPLPRATPRTSPPPPPSARSAPPGALVSSATVPLSAEANVSDAVVTCLRKIAEISGVLGAAFIDFQNGETLGSVTRDMVFDTIAVARANVEVVRAKLALLSSLGIRDTIQDIVITTRSHYHVLCLSERRPRQFVFVALSREHSTLALARFLIEEAIEGSAPSSSGSAGSSGGSSVGASYSAH